jgi:hypothetical protein
MIIKAKEVISSDDYLPLPSKFDIHEYHIMEEFCYSVVDEKIRRVLSDKIRGSGAFRRFKDAICKYEFEDVQSTSRIIPCAKHIGISRQHSWQGRRRKTNCAIYTEGKDKNRNSMSLQAAP